MDIILTRFIRDLGGPLGRLFRYRQFWEFRHLLRSRGHSENVFDLLLRLLKTPKASEQEQGQKLWRAKKNRGGIFATWPKIANWYSVSLVMDCSGLESCLVLSKRQIWLTAGWHGAVVVLRASDRKWHVSRRSFVLSSRWTCFQSGLVNLSFEWIPLVFFDGDSCSFIMHFMVQHFFWPYASSGRIPEHHNEQLCGE